MSTSSGRRVVGTKFFKIILNPEADRIRIPPEFTKRYGHDLPSRVFLKVPTRPPMEAELTRCDDGQTWIHKGWQEFKDSHSICFGYLLLFEYDGKSEFKVLIFDKGAVEIIYDINGVANANIDRDLQTYFSTPLLDYFSPNHIPVSYEFIRGQIDFVDEQILFARAQLEKFSAMRAQFAALVSSQAKAIQGSSGGHCADVANADRVHVISDDDDEDDGDGDDGADVDDDDDDNSDVDETKYPIHDKKRNDKGKNQEVMKTRKGKAKDQEIMRGISSRLKEERPNFDGSSSGVRETWDAYQKAEDYVSSRARKNPFFISVMRKSYVRNKYSMYVPFPFCGRNLPHLGTLSIVLVTNGKEWLVRCRNAKSRAEFLTIGWRKFVQDNGIKLGDACVFEVADRIDSKGNELVWDVFIFRN
ncbi:B3 domain-containing protein [Striga asiatica]|uniref:B3 domain-containing protein n=1 Tax=Striga asiatica TaxID=4170 RepID=A0A5A7PE53_STRAF|nr:B3 domain-containing protein [Striga asiatica]